MSPDESPNRPPGWSDDDVLDSRTAATLRQAFSREAARVRPAGDGLARIQARTQQPPGAARRGWLMPVAAAAVSVAIAGGVGWATLDRGDGTPAASDGPGETATGPAPSTSAEGTRVAIPVYYVGEQPGAAGSAPEYRLFREFHPTTALDTADRDSRIEVALGEMFANEPLDPDYRATLWPASTRVGAVTVDAQTDIASVDLVGVDSAELSDAPTMDAELGAVTVQELVFTVTAAASFDGYQLAGVQILLDGAVSDTIFGVDTAEPLQRDTGPYRAAIWVLSIDDGATLTNPVIVTGQARLEEPASGRWTVSKDGATISSGEFDTQKCCAYEDFAFRVPDTLAPGNYLLTVYDGAAGNVGSAPYDSKSFVVEGPN